MPTLVHKLTVDHATPPPTPYAIERLVKALEDMNAAVPCNFFLFSQTNAGPPQKFTYKIAAIDGRIWTQTATFDIQNDPRMTFDIPAGWRLSEFVSHRPLRDLCVDYVTAYGVTKIRYDF